MKRYKNDYNGKSIAKTGCVVIHITTLECWYTLINLPQLVPLHNVNVHIIYLIYDGLMLQYAITMRYICVLIGLD
jgi:hypothetical protein